MKRVSCLRKCGRKCIHFYISSCFYRFFFTHANPPPLLSTPEHKCSSWKLMIVWFIGLKIKGMHRAKVRRVKTLHTNHFAPWSRSHSAVSSRGPASFSTSEAENDGEEHRRRLAFMCFVVKESKFRFLPTAASNDAQQQQQQIKPLNQWTRKGTTNITEDPTEETVSEMSVV